ncbi:hypothetical protein ABBQ38_013905 [Trebouxia sp. C0009 RCD-2024]
MTYVRLHISIEDVEHANLLPYLDAASSFITQALNSGGCVLVHCAAGISRSATVVAAHLMVTEQMTADEAMKSLRQTAPWVHPNPGFMHQLALFHDMGLRVDPSYGPYRTMMLSQRRQLATLNTRPLRKHVQDGDWVCQHCSRLLVSSHCVVPRQDCSHSMEESAHDAPAAGQPSLLIRPQRWMGGSIAAAQTGAGSGLHCPTCGIQVGMFLWGSTAMPGIADLHMPDGVHHPRPQLWISAIAASQDG